VAAYAATTPNEPHECILTHFNNCNFSKAQIVYSLMMVFYTETCRSFVNVNFNANLKLFLRLSNFASVGEKTLIINYYISINEESRPQNTFTWLIIS
jgi:hypothetical protein